MRNKPTLLHEKSTVFHDGRMARDRVSARVYLVVVEDPTPFLGQVLSEQSSRIVLNNNMK